MASLIPFLLNKKIKYKVVKTTTKIVTKIKKKRKKIYIA